MTELSALMTALLITLPVLYIWAIVWTIRMFTEDGDLRLADLIWVLGCAPFFFAYGAATVFWKWWCQPGIENRLNPVIFPSRAPVERNKN